MKLRHIIADKVYQIIGGRINDSYREPGETYDVFTKRVNREMREAIISYLIGKLEKFKRNEKPGFRPVAIEVNAVIKKIEDMLNGERGE